MKKIKIITFVFCFVFAFGVFCACAAERPKGPGTDPGTNPGQDEPEITDVQMPQNLKIDAFNDIINWEAAEDATSYVVSMNGQTFDVDATTLDISDFEPDTYTIMVKAIKIVTFDDKEPVVKESDYTDPVTYNLNNMTSQEFESKYVTFTQNIPTLKINTKNGVPVNSDKEIYTDAVASIENTLEEYCLNNWQIEIRGRGNTTWGHPKKPYRIKAKSKTSVFGFKAVKNWALLAEYSDKSFMRNYFAHMLGRSLDGIDFSANCIYVELELNGVYDGLYLMTDQMESGESRVDVEQIEVDSNGNLIDTGFMLEIDDRASGHDSLEVEGRDYFRIYPSDTSFREAYNFVIKYPKYDEKIFENNQNLFYQVLDFMENYIYQVFEAIGDINRNNNYRKFNELCDENSFIDYWLVQELTKNTDADALSLFVNRKIGAKLKMGPLWDFDIGIGNSAHIPETGNTYGWYNRNKNIWFAGLSRNSTFNARLKKRYNKIYGQQITLAINALSKVETDIASAVERNFSGDLKTRYSNTDKGYSLYDFGYYLWPNPQKVVEANTFHKQVLYVQDYLTQRGQWMKSNL